MNPEEKGLILIADDEEFVCGSYSEFLQKLGYRTAVAHDGVEALQSFTTMKPQLVIADIHMPRMSGLEFLGKAREIDSDTPVIITTGRPDMDSAISAIHNGAYDYIVKPCRLEILDRKITQALKTRKLARENAVLAQLVSLHEIANKLTSTHDLHELLDITFKHCLDVSRSSGGSIELYDKKTHELVVVVQKWAQTPTLRISMADGQELSVSKWVFTNKEPLRIIGRQTFPQTDLVLNRDDLGSAISVPMRIGSHVIGVVNLNRPPDQEPFSMVDLNLITVLVGQASIAINNATLYSSIHQKLNELTLVGTYAEQLMSKVDTDDVISCLFETVRKNFPIDIVGLLVIQKRNHDFLYWSRGVPSSDALDSICREVVEVFNHTSRTNVSMRRVFVRPFGIHSLHAAKITAPTVFKHIVPMTGENFNYGAIYFGSLKPLENAADQISLLSSLVNQTRIALTTTRLYGDIKENYIRTIKALAIAVDAKDTYTHGHSENVMNIAEEICREMNIDERWIGIIRDAALLHDIGKIGIPGTILKKRGKLVEDQYKVIMKNHSVLGANIVKDVPFFNDLYALILHHHEHYDGSGYPDGLVQGNIPLGARIILVADAFEAMTSNRPYRNSLGVSEALRRLRAGRGTQFDPTVVDAFLKIAERKGWMELSY